MTKKGLHGSRSGDSSSARTAYNDVPSTISVEGQRILESAVLVVDETTHDLADLFQKENPHFDRDRFLIGAGVPR